jgi:hypothetical protein
VRTLMLVLALFVPLALRTTAANSAPKRTTKVVVVVPVTPAGDLQTGYRITKRFATGHCLDGSDTVRGAYRCFAANYVLDPCWPTTVSGSTSVVCTTAPWSKKLAEIRRPGSLGPSTGGLPPSPLGIQLTDGTHCVIGDGALSVYRGRVVRWACGRGGDGLLGQPTRSNGLWTIPRVHYDAKARKFVLGPLGRVAVFYEGKAFPWR